jgi:hypothetical protein
MSLSTWSAEEHAFFLGQLVAILSSTMDYERMLHRMARLAVPILGDLCAVDLVETDGVIRRAACAHVDATKENLAYEVPRSSRRLPPRTWSRRPRTPTSSISSGRWG